MTFRGNRHATTCNCTFFHLRSTECCTYGNQKVFGYSMVNNNVGLSLPVFLASKGIMKKHEKCHRSLQTTLLLIMVEKFFLKKNT